MIKNFPKPILFIIDALILLYCTGIYIFSLNQESNSIFKLITLVLIVALGLYAFLRQKIDLGRFTFYLILFVLYCGLSQFWAIRPDLSFGKTFTLLQISAVSVLMYNYLKIEKKTDFLIAALCFSTTAFAFYSVMFYGVSDFVTGLEQGLRMGEEITNVNIIGMASAIGASFNLWYILYKKKLINILFFALCVFAAFATASKKSLLIVVAALIIMFILKGNKKQKIISIFACIILLVSLFQLLQTPMFGKMGERFEKMFKTLSGSTTNIDGSTYQRMKMLEGGLEYFSRYPVLGIGLENSGIITHEYLGFSTYLHSNYIELLATLGMVGAVLYYIMYFVPLKSIFKPALKSDIYAILAFSLIIIYAVVDIALVSYYSKMTYLYIILFFLVSEKMKEQIND